LQNNYWFIGKNLDFLLIINKKAPQQIRSPQGIKTCLF